MEVFGLPLHPLVVHAVVVLVPLSSLGLVAGAVSVWVRRRYGWLVAAFATIALISTVVAVAAGNDFLTTFPRPTEQMLLHQQVAGGLLPWVIVLFLGSVALALLQTLIDRGRDQRGFAIAVRVGAVLAIVVAIGATIQVVRAGHSGSSAVWG